MGYYLMDFIYCQVMWFCNVAYLLHTTSLLYFFCYVFFCIFKTKCNISVSSIQINYNYYLPKLTDQLLHLYGRYRVMISILIYSRTSCFSVHVFSIWYQRRSVPSDGEFSRSEAARSARVNYPAQTAPAPGTLPARPVAITELASILENPTLGRVIF